MEDKAKQQDRARLTGLSNIGRKHTQATLTKKSDALKGRSYVDLLGEEKACELKNSRSQRMKRTWVEKHDIMCAANKESSMIARNMYLNDAEYREAYTAALSKSLYEAWNSYSAERRDERIGNILRGNQRKPNKPEAYICSMLQFIRPNEWKYVGDGQFILGGKCPDFVNINGEKKIIELFGDYWHKGQKAQDRIDIFSRYGYKTLVIWENELKNNKDVTNKILTFVGEKL
jgi:very-short-patch-repair endonuclease